MLHLEVALVFTLLCFLLLCCVSLALLLMINIQSSGLVISASTGEALRQTGAASDGDGAAKNTTLAAFGSLQIVAGGSSNLLDGRSTSLPVCFLFASV